MRYLVKATTRVRQNMWRTFFLRLLFLRGGVSDVGELEGICCIGPGSVPSLVIALTATHDDTTVCGIETMGVGSVGVGASSPGGMVVIGAERVGLAYRYQQPVQET